MYTGVRRNFLFLHEIEVPLSRRRKNCWCLCEKSRATEDEKHTNGAQPSFLVVNVPTFGYHGDQELQDQAGHHWRSLKQVLNVYFCYY